MNLYELENSKNSRKSGISKKKETEFHAKLDTLVHDTFGKREGEIAENAEGLNIGDPVIIAGDVQYKGKTGEIVDFGQDNRFVIVDLYNYGKHSFHSSDVSFNDYDSENEELDEANPHNFDSDVDYYAAQNAPAKRYSNPQGAIPRDPADDSYSGSRAERALRADRERVKKAWADHLAKQKEQGVAEGYSMADVQRDAQANARKTIDAATAPKEKTPFMAQVGKKIIGGVAGAVTGGVKGAYKGFTGQNEGTESEHEVKKHVVLVTVVDPNATAVSQRGALLQRRAKVKAVSQEAAVEAAVKWYRKQGYKVTDHLYAGLDDSEGRPTVEKSNLGELSNELLGRYKKELGVRASAADKAGDYDKGHEYFKKINKATIRQGENDARKHEQDDMMETRLDMMRKAGYDL